MIVAKAKKFPKRFVAWVVWTWVNGCGWMVDDESATLAEAREYVRGQRKQHRFIRKSLKFCITRMTHTLVAK